MIGLLKADFRRILKDKLLMVMGILAVAFAVVTPLLYVGLFAGLGGEDLEMISGYISSKTQFFASFSLGNNLGLIVPVLLGIALCKDFSFGTVRNKIIAGKSRSQIFLSLFITCSAVFLGVMLLHAFITLGVSLLFFEYQSEPFAAADFGYFMASLGFDLLMLLFAAAMLSWLCASMKNVGLVIVLYIASFFMLVIAGSITQVAIPLMELTGSSERAISILTFFDRINVGNAAVYIGMGTEYTLEDVLYLTIPAITGTLFFVGLGLWNFNKKDLK